VHCGQTVGWIKTKLGMQVGLGPGHIVLDGDPPPRPQRGTTCPQFSAHICCGQVAAWINQDATWYGGRPRPNRLCVRWGPRSLAQKGAEPHPPKFSADVYCRQTAGWIKMVLGMALILSPGDFVLDGDPAPSEKGGRAPSPIFGPCLSWPNGWMHQDVTWYGGRPQPRGLCIRWGPCSPLSKTVRSP